MSIRVESYKDKNSFYEYINPWIFKDRKEIKIADKENFDPIESVGLYHPVKAVNLLTYFNAKDEKSFHKKWVNELFSIPSSSFDYKQRLINEGYSEEQSSLIIGNSMKDVERKKSWSSTNQSLALTASRYVTATMILGAIYELFAKGESTPSLTKTLLKMAHGFCMGQRGLNQYTLYGAHDDDLAQNIYQGDIYGNVVASEFGQFAHTTETKVKPLALPLLGFLPDFWKDNLTRLLSLPDALWWRVRMPAHINQEFLTDLFRYIFHKPLAIFGDKDSIKTLEEIKQRGNIDPAYVIERHYKNAGLIDKKDQTPPKLIDEVIKLFKGSFSKDIDIQSDSAKKLNTFLAPTFSLFSFTSMTVGTVIKSFLGEGGKPFEILSEFGKAAQHAIYFFRMVIPEFNQVKRIAKTMGSGLRHGPKPTPQHNLEEVNEFYKEKKNFLFISTAYSVTSLLLPFVKLLEPQNEKLQRLKGLFQEITGDLVSKFFSHRRYLLGRQFKVENPEFY